MSILDVWEKAGAQARGGDPMPSYMGADDYARSTRAWIARQQWNDYQSRFQPIEQELINTVTTPDMLNQRLSAIRGNVSSANDASAQVEDMMLRRYGVRPDAQQQQVNSTNQQLAGTISSVDAANNTRAAIYDRNQAVLGGGAIRADSISASTQQGN